MSDISPKDIWGYQTKRKQDGVKPVTINRELAFLSTAINFANRHWEWGLSNPVTGRKLSNVGSARTRWLTRDEANRLLEAASSEPKAPHLSDFIRLALYTGARRGELLGLEWSRVDLRANIIYLEAIHTKTGTPRAIPLCKTARQALIGRQRFRASFCPDARSCSSTVTDVRFDQSGNPFPRPVGARLSLIFGSTTCDTPSPAGW